MYIYDCNIDRDIDNALLALERAGKTLENTPRVAQLFITYKAVASGAIVENTPRRVIDTYVKTMQWNGDKYHYYIVEYDNGARVSVPDCAILAFIYK